MWYRSAYQRVDDPLREALARVVTQLEPLAAGIATGARLSSPSEIAALQANWRTGRLHLAKALQAARFPAASSDPDIMATALAHSLRMMGAATVREAQEVAAAPRRKGSATDQHAAGTARAAFWEPQQAAYQHMLNAGKTKAQAREIMREAAGRPWRDRGTRTLRKWLA